MYTWTKELDLSQPPFYSTSMALWNLQCRHSHLHSRLRTDDCLWQTKQNPQPTGPNTSAMHQDIFTTGITWPSSSTLIAGPTPIKHVASVSDSSNKVTMVVQLCRALMDYLLPLHAVTLIDLEPGISFLPTTTAGTSQGYYSVPIQQKILAKCRTSFCRWITTIIWQCWATAWDLLVHWNVEDLLLGYGLPITQPQYWHRTSHCPWPKYPVHHQPALIVRASHMLLQQVSDGTPSWTPLYQYSGYLPQHCCMPTCQVALPPGAINGEVRQL